MDLMQPWLDYLSAHPGWALVIIFAIAFGEALLVIGLFVPSTVVLVGAGVLVGWGKLPFWPVIGLTAFGAIAGDQVSFWAGRFYGQRLKQLWPLRNYESLVLKGETFVREHGGKSIAIGRFIPGIKAVIPGIIGMLGMPQMRFLIVNIVSGIAWAFIHVLPGVLVGQGLAIAGEYSGRLALLLGILVAIVMVAGTLIRMAVAWMWPLVEKLQGRFERWTQGQSGTVWTRAGRLLGPANRRAPRLIFYALAMLIALGIGLWLIGRVGLANYIPNIDRSTFRFMEAIRSTPADHLMLMLSMLGIWPVLLALLAGMVLWLWCLRYRRLASILAACAGVGALFLVIMKTTVDRPRPAIFPLLETWSFPSTQALGAAFVFGSLATLLCVHLGRWSRSLVFAICGSFVVAIGFSNVYLGLGWLSDVVAGVLFGCVLMAIFGFFVEARPPHRLRPLWFGLFAVLVFVVAAGTNFYMRFDQAAQTYISRPKETVLAFNAWHEGAWRTLPRKRTTFRGLARERFIAQWAGSADTLTGLLEKSGWTRATPWRWQSAFTYLSSEVPLTERQPAPELDHGATAAMTLVFDIASQDERRQPNSRYVLRLWDTDHVLAQENAALPLYAVTLTMERPGASSWFYNVPETLDANRDADTRLLKTIAGLPGVILYANGTAETPALFAFKP